MASNPVPSPGGGGDENLDLIFMSVFTRLPLEQLRALCWRDYSFERGQLTVPAQVWGRPFDLVICLVPWKQRWLAGYYRHLAKQRGTAPRMGDLIFP